LVPVGELPDPRVWPDAAVAGGTAARVHAAARAAIDAATGHEADVRAAEATRLLEALLERGDGDALAGVFATAPSLAIARFLWRLLALVERGEPQRSATLRAVLFALPVAIVAAHDARDAQARIDGVLHDRRALEALLVDAREFGGATTFALSSALCAAEAIDIGALPGLLTRLPLEAAQVPLDLPPAPIDVDTVHERVHLRFLAGVVLAAPGPDPLQVTAIAHWGMPFAQALARELHVTGVSLLALPRPPQRLVPALQNGRAVQRDVSARIFASNAIRRLRASYGEPTAVISAHRAPAAPGGGELRLSLSSPFAPREAEGFRCPLHPYEAVQDVATMLANLLRDCRIGDVRVRVGVHADLDPVTGGPLLFKDAGMTDAAPLH
jgi:hypothetical protein